MADLSQTLNAPLSNPITGLYPDAAPEETSAPVQAGTEDVYAKLGLSTPAKPQFKPMPVPDVKKEIAARQEFMQPGMKKEEQLVKDIGQFEGAKALNEAEGRLKEAEGTYRAQQQYAEAMKMKDLEDKKQKLESEMAKPFIPSQENAQDMAALFSLVNVIGFAFGAGGKENAQLALSAMNGMLEGHQKGRDDLYKREKDVFEENLKVLKNKWEMLQSDMERAAELAKTDLEVATQKARIDAAKIGATFIKDNIDKYGLLPTLELVKKNNEAMTKAYDIATKHKQDVEMKNAELLNKYLQAGAGTKGSAINSRLAYMIHNSFLQAGKDIVNAARHPSLSLGAFSGLTGADSKGIIDGIKKVGTRTVTAPENRTFEQIISGIEGHMSRVMGGGYAQSSTKAMMDMYKTQIPRSGDPEVVGLMFLARMKQELGLELQGFGSHPGASPEMLKNMMDTYSEVDKLIPFNVQQIQQAIGESPDLQAALQKSSFGKDEEDELKRLEKKSRE